MKHLLDKYEIHLEILQHSVPVLSHHPLQLSELININLVYFHRDSPDVHLVKRDSLEDLG